MDVVVESGEGTRFRDLRQAHGLTLQQVADATGFSLSHLSNVERGARRATEYLVRVYANLASIAIQSPPCPVTPISSHAANPISAQPDSSDDFGTRLLRLRLSRGLSLAELSAATHVSKSYLGNLERGRKHPSATVAAACDNELAAGGALITLRMAPIGSARTDMPIPAPSTDDHIAETLDPDSDLAFGEAEFLELRRAAQGGRPRPLAQTLARRSRSLARAAALCEGSRARRLWLLAARCAEFTGWLAAEADEIAASRAWTDAAATWAAAGGDLDMAGYRWERLALTALYRSDAAETVALARRGLVERGVSPRIKGLAMRRMAQGHALAGNASACQRALDEAVGLLARGPSPFPRGPSWGPNTIDDVSGLIRASCLVDLGACRSAIALLGPDPDAWAPGVATRTRARFIVRGAMAFAGAGELDHACALAEFVLPDVLRVDSATVRVDVHKLVGVMLRHPTHPHSRALLPELISATRVY